MPPKFKQEVTATVSDEVIQKIVDKTVTVKEDNDKKKIIMDKIEAIKKTVKDKKEKEHSDGTTCPTCHKHDLVVDGTTATAKCVGSECSKEYVLLDLNTDIECANCHLPVSDKKDEPCPYCGSKHGIKSKHGSLKYQLELLKKDLKRK